MKLLGLVLLAILTQCLTEEFEDFNREVNDYYFLEEADMQLWFGSKHHQKNKQLTPVTVVKPLLWG
jgi:hypothetical protein